MTSDNTIPNQPISVVLACLGLGVMAVTLTFVCTWMTNRKRRVGSHVTTKHGSLVLEPAPSRTTQSNPISGQPRYTTNSHGLSPLNLHHNPDIIITPPTPLALIANSPSGDAQWKAQGLTHDHNPSPTSPLLESDSSIGSASDLMIDTTDVAFTSSTNKDCCRDSLDGGLNQDEKRVLKELRIKEFKYKDSVFKDIEDYDYRTSENSRNNAAVSSNQTVNASVESYACQHDVDITEVTSRIKMTSISSNSEGDKLSDRVCVIVESDFVLENDISDVLSSSAPRPRLSSIEPGTSRPNVFRIQALEETV